jgi:phospholipase C
MSEKVEHVVVLLLENRSFDHMLGYFPSNGVPFEGLTGNEVNFEHPLTSTGFSVSVSADAPYVPDIDPGPDHDIANVQLQLFGRSGDWPADPVALHNNGFLYDYAQVTKDVRTAAPVMRCHGPDHVPALTALAQQFALCDHWFASVPGPTWPNRFFVHAATSGGHTDNAVRLYEMRTLYENLSDANVGWRIYFHDFPQSLALEQQLRYIGTNYEYIARYFADCAAGTLPAYSFIEPRYFNEGMYRANDWHPIHGVVNGDMLIADVYEALRASPLWERSMLIVATDEHGGLFDHVLPPPAVNPDGKNSPEFDFTRLGVRVPAVVASPWIAKGTVSQTVYDHTTLAATARDLFGVNASLTKRDAAANTLLPLLTLDAPRTDAPLELPRASADAIALTEAAQPPNRGLSHVQSSLVALARMVMTKAPEMLHEPFSSALLTTEREGAIIAKYAFGMMRRVTKFPPL